MANPRAKAAMSARWKIAHQQQRGRRGVRLTREAEEAAMARFVEERGVTACDAAGVLTELGVSRVVSQPTTM